MSSPRKSTEEQDLEDFGQMKGYGSKDTAKAAQEELAKKRLKAMKKMAEESK